MDALAAHSVNFEQAVTPHPFGVFARAAFLTGKPCPENGIRDYYDPLPEDARTLAHDFGALDYDTAFFGKWQLYERDPADPVVGEEHARIVVPQNRRGGFAFWEGFESGFLLNDGLYHGTRIPEPVRIEGYQSDVIVDRFASYMNEKGSDRPLFALLSFDAPHPPYATDVSGVLPPMPEQLKLLSNVSTDPSVQAVVRRELSGYYAHIEATDRALGRLMNGLRDKDMWNDTIFVFTSAHGDLHGSHGYFRKGWPYEEAVRVPLLVSWPRSVVYGIINDSLVSLQDVGKWLLSIVKRDGWSESDDGSQWVERLCGEGGSSCQTISMPSVPPFAKQCPYVWEAKRNRSTTEVIPEGMDPFTLDHSEKPTYRMSSE